MDFEMLLKAVDGLVSPEAKPPAPTPPAPTKPKPTEKKMTVDQFRAYAKEQVTKAQAEHEAKKPDLSTKRLTALKAEVEKIQKFEFKPGELPTVVIYKDEMQLDTTETEIQPVVNEPDGQSNYTAKSTEFGRFLDAQIKALNTSNRPQDKKAEESAPAVLEGDNDWPADLAKSCVKPTRRDGDKDYDWGSDPAA